MSKFKLAMDNYKVLNFLNLLIAVGLFVLGLWHRGPAMGLAILVILANYAIVRENKLKKLTQELRNSQEALSTAEATIRKLEPWLTQETKRADEAEQAKSRLQNDLELAQTSLEQNRETVRLALIQRDQLTADLRIKNEAVANLDRLKVHEHEQVLAWSFRLRAPHESVNPPKETVQAVTREMEAWVRQRLPADRADALFYRHEKTQPATTRSITT